MASRQLTDLVNDRRSRIEESDLVPIWLPDFTDDFFGRIYSRIVRIVSRRVVRLRHEEKLSEDRISNKLSEQLSTCQITANAAILKRVSRSDRSRSPFTAHRSPGSDFPADFLRHPDRPIGQPLSSSVAYWSLSRPLAQVSDKAARPIASAYRARQSSPKWLRIARSAMTWPACQRVRELSPGFQPGR